METLFLGLIMLALICAIMYVGVEIIKEFMREG